MIQLLIIDYLAAVQAEKSNYQVANKQHFDFGTVDFDILTSGGNYEDVNNYSVVTRLDYGDIEFLFTGDAEAEVEASLTGQIDTEILKVGHHGSNSSSTLDFLNKVKPQVAVISVGADNTYGHPTQETIQRLQNVGADVYRTDLNGSVIVTTDGKTYDIDTQKNGVSTPNSPVVQPQPQPPVAQPVPAPAPVTSGKYVGSMESDKFHYPSCRSAKNIKPENQIWFKDAADAQAHGYESCGICKPS